ncbi:MAG: metallophosphoesterase [Candidatus Woesearchaeota archaeon]|nr:metallophosphoesterase [Candidatus Woesearchaeota archaeon]
MKLLFFADLHGDKESMNILRNKAKDADGIVCAGDFTRMERDIEGIMKNLDSFGKTMLMIHGNHEDADTLKDLCQKYKNLNYLHKGVFHVGDYVFLGYGGDGFSTNDPEFEKVANKFFKKEAEGKKRIILVTHMPPYGTEIDKIEGEHRGNKSYKKFIDDVKPHLVISGHLHETAGKHQKIGRTLLINPGKDGVTVDI